MRYGTRGEPKRFLYRISKRKKCHKNHHRTQSTVSVRPLFFFYPIRSLDYPLSVECRHLSMLLFLFYFIKEYVCAIAPSGNIRSLIYSRGPYLAFCVSLNDGERWSPRREHGSLSMRYQFSSLKIHLTELGVKFLRGHVSRPVPRGWEEKGQKRLTQRDSQLSGIRQGAGMLQSQQKKTFQVTYMVGQRFKLSFFFFFVRKGISI